MICESRLRLWGFFFHTDSFSGIIHRMMYIMFFQFQIYICTGCSIFCLSFWADRDVFSLFVKWTHIFFAGFGLHETGTDMRSLLDPLWFKDLYYVILFSIEIKLRIFPRKNHGKSNPFNVLCLFCKSRIKMALSNTLLDWIIWCKYLRQHLCGQEWPSWSMRSCIIYG